jgi:ABC-type thiamin/hydroxymethylpyrimidine transport system permease subunit
MPVWYPTLELSQQLVIGFFMLLSAVIIAGVGSWLLMRSLVQTGVLAQFTAGRAQQRV